MVKRPLILFLIFLFSWREVFSSAEESPIDLLVNFKSIQGRIIKKNDLSKIYEIGEKVDTFSGVPQKRTADLIRLMREKGIDGSWLRWFEQKHGRSEKIGYKAFAAAIFYPYELMEASYKYHISQMNVSFKACIHYSSGFASKGIGRLITATLDSKIDWSIKSDDNLLEWLDVTFVVHNGAFTEKAREYLGIGGNLDRLFDHIMGGGTATQQFNFGVIAKSLGKLDMAIPCFRNAVGQGSRRAELELAYYEIERGEDVAGRLSALGPYGLWKIAQCFRYGKKVEKDLKEANRYYLQALAGADEFPEIAYDTGDFVEELALGQKDKGRFIETARKAMDYFNMAGERHLGSGYIRAARLMITARERFSDLATTDFNDDAISDLAFKAAQEGAYEKAKSLLERIGRDASSLLSPGTVGISKFVKDINEKFG